MEQLVEGAEPDPNYLSNIPSWTWLSCPHKVWFDFPMYSIGSDEVKWLYDIQDPINLVEWAVDWISEPLTSSVKSTRLILEGPIEKFVLSISDKGKCTIRRTLTLVMRSRISQKGHFHGGVQLSSMIDSEHLLLSICVCFFGPG
jgi:hypothetical protein